MFCDLLHTQWPIRTFLLLLVIGLDAYDIKKARKRPKRGNIWLDDGKEYLIRRFPSIERIPVMETAPVDIAQRLVIVVGGPRSRRESTSKSRKFVKLSRYCRAVPGGTAYNRCAKMRCDSLFA